MGEGMYDVLVVGLGAAGSAACRSLAARGLRVAGFDRYVPPHAQGSSHGASRILREAYFEHPSYVPLVQAAYPLWAALEKESGRPLLTITGGLMVGPPDGELVSGARRSAEAFGLPHEMFGSEACALRFPAFRLAPGHVALWEPRAGVLDPEACVAAQCESARAAGAELHTNTAVESFEASPGSVAIRVRADGGEARTVRARTLVLAAGPWSSDLLPHLPLTVERQTMHFFAPSPRHADVLPGRMPIFVWEAAPQTYFYGFPDLGAGVKVARHHGGTASSPHAVDREVHEADRAPVRAFAAAHLPGGGSTLMDSRVCLYTNTPDQHFILDRHPLHENVIVACCCSGHGFKFAPVIGVAAAALATGEEPPWDLSPFRITRFAAS